MDQEQRRGENYELLYYNSIRKYEDDAFDQLSAD